MIVSILDLIFLYMQLFTSLRPLSFKSIFNFKPERKFIDGSRIERNRYFNFDPSLKFANKA